MLYKIIYSLNIDHWLEIILILRSLHLTYAKFFFGTDNKCYRIHVLKGLICVLMYVHRIFLMKWICLYFSLIFIISRNQYRYIYDHIFVLYRKAGTKAENRRNYSPPLKYHNKYFFKNPLNSQGFFTKLYYLYFLNQVMPLRKCMHYIRDMLHM